MKWILPSTMRLANKIATFFRGTSLKLYDVLIKPKQVDEEIHRKEIVCNLLLTFILALTILLNVLVIKSSIHFGPRNYDGIRPIIMVIITGSIICLLYLSRKGYVSLSSEILVWIIIAGCTYGQITWGADLPSVILLWCFIITASSILISTRYSFFLALAVSLGTIILQILEDEHTLKPLKDWKNTSFKLDDAIEYAFVFTLIAGVSWISNREIFKSLLKVKQSKLELQIERDSLEVKVIERTRELHQAQVDKINSMYQLVEFGRISSGLFHDLMTPLNSLDFAVRQICNNRDIKENKDVEQLHKQLDICIRTSSRIVDFIDLAKRQIQQTDDSVRFEIDKEIESTISLIESRARHNNVKLILKSQRKVFIQGSPTLFSHVITNLLSNAIDSYSSDLEQLHRTDLNTHYNNQIVLIYVQKKHKFIEIKIKDFGSGIPNEIQQKIFDPFFTTKTTTGCGIGLSATKHTLEKYFNGNISFVSYINTEKDYSTETSQKTNQGTTFTIKIPISQNTN